MRLFLGGLLILLLLVSPAHAVDVVVGTTGTISGVTDGAKGDITVSGTGTVWTIAPGVVTYAKIQNVSTTARLLGRNSAGAGPIEELSSATVKSMLGLSFGDLTGSATDAQIPDLNTLSTGLTASRCVETDGTGKLGVAAGVCGAGGGGTITVSGTPTAGQSAEWVSATAIQGVAVTGTGSYVKATSPVLTTPNLGTPSALNLTNATNVPLAQSTGALPNLTALPPAARATIALTFAHLGGS